MITFSVIKSRTLSTKARDIILKTIFHGQDTGRFHLYAVCIMPDHVHLLIEPQTKEEDAQEAPIFWNLKEILHSIKSFSAHEINKIEQKHGPLWEKESYDRLIRSEADLHEKFAYICNNPWNNNIVSHSEDYPWLWTENEPRRDAEADTRDACAPQKISESSSSQNAPQISGAFAFKLYDTYGFPLDLTELMARERGLSVDVTEFDRLMEEQRSRARLAQKREVIELSQIEKEHPTLFCGYDQLDTQARVLDIIQIKGRTAVITDHSVCYAEMGGQVGDTGTLNVDGKLWAITDTRKAGQTWLHFLEGEPTFEPGTEIKLHVNPRRRAAIQRHHTVTHLFHWALHEVVSTDATQKGSFVGPDKLTFDFNSAPLTKDQIRTIEQLVNERILENAPVSWIEIPYESVRNRKDVLQFFGEKYGDHVRVVQIGGTPQALNGYSMELCGGTHTQTTGEIGFFRITAESAIAAGIRRIEAIAGLCAYESAIQDYARLQQLAETLNAPISELEKKLASILAQNKALEKQLATLSQKQAADTAKSLLTHIEQFPKANAIIRHVGDLNGEQLQLIAEQLRSQFEGVLLLIGTGQGRVHLLASVSTNLTNTFQAGKIIQTLAPKVGGKGGGKPELARGAGCDVDGIPNAIAEAKAFLS